MSRNRFKFRHSSAFRLALQLSGIFLISLILMAGIAYFQSEKEIRKRAYRDLQDLQKSFLTVSQTQGIDRLQQQIEFLSMGAKSGETLYYLTGPDNQFLAGNVNKIPLFDGRRDIPLSQIELKMKVRGDVRKYFSLGLKIGDGHLILGRSDYEVEEIGEVILNAFFAGFGISLFLTLFVAFLSAYRVNMRIKRIESGLIQASQGDLSIRIPEGTSEDDINLITQKINRMLEQLQATVESLRQVSADMAHELKTPLQRLYQELEELAEQSDLPKQSAVRVNKAFKEANTLIETFQALLRISQLESGERRQGFKDLNVTHLLTNIAEIYAPVAEDEGHQLSLDLAIADDLTIYGDFGLLTQLLANLIENSVTHCKTPCKINLGAKQEGKNLIISVTDTGPGIPSAEREKVFERLYRLEKSRTTAGTGLGLSLVKAIADLHGCQITLEDHQPGLGVFLSFA